MRGDIAAIYGRAWDFIRAMPAIALLPLLVQLAQSALSTVPTLAYGREQTVAFGFTILNTLAMLVVTVFALRWWRFQRDRVQMRRIGWRVVWGAAAMMAIQLTDEYLFTSAGRLVASTLGWGWKLFVPAAQLMWLLVSVPLYPWYVALLSDDRELSLRQAVRSVRPQWLQGFALVLAALLPWLAIGFALRFAMAALPPWHGGAMAARLAFMLLVPMLIVTTASAYFAIYRRVRGTSLPPGEASA